MGKRKERENKECLNCGEKVLGRFCQNCGQENIEQKEPIGRVFLYLIEGFTFFNSKFFKTFTPLLFKPGALTQDYLKGKRATFLNPVKTYFFLSFLYFLLFFGVGTKTNVLTLDPLEEKSKPGVTINDSTKTNRKNVSLGFEGDNWVSRKLEKLKNKAKNEGGDIGSELNRVYSSNIPNVVFFVMPFLALLLKVFYWKRYLIEHLIHALHIHSFSFILFILMFLLGFIIPNDGELLGLLSILLIIIYFTVSCYKVYYQKAALTIAKSLSILLLYSVLLGIGFMVNIIVTLAMI